MLRGIVHESSNPNWPAHEKRIIEANGLIEITSNAAEHFGTNDQRVLHIIQILSSFAQLLVMTEVFRRVIDRPRMEVGFNFEWRIPSLTHIMMPGGSGFFDRLRPHKEINCLLDLAIAGDVNVDDVWLDIQREFFHSFGQEIGNFYSVDFDKAIDGVMERLTPLRSITV